MGIPEAIAKVGWILLSELNNLSLAGSNVVVTTARLEMILRLVLLLFYLSLFPLLLSMCFHCKSIGFVIMLVLRICSIQAF